MKTKIFTIVLILVFFHAHAQNMISGKSGSQKRNLKPNFERQTFPPDFELEVEFVDDNKNNFLEAMESALLKIKITNKGLSKAQNVVIKLTDHIYNIDQNMTDMLTDGGINITPMEPHEIYKEKPLLNYEKRFAFIERNGTVELEVPIKTDINLKSAYRKIDISITEQFYGTQTSILNIYSLEYQKPELKILALDIHDGKSERKGMETYGDSDGKIQPGELVRIGIKVANMGNNIAKDVKYIIRSTDANIYLYDDKSGSLGDIFQGTTKEFWFGLSTNRDGVYPDTLPVFLSLEEKFGKVNISFQLPLVLNESPPPPVIIPERKVADLAKLYQIKLIKPIQRPQAKNLLNIREVKKTETVRENAVGIVIGIEEYSNYLLPSFYSENDADIMKEYFEKRLGIKNTLIYKNHEASTRNFKNIFNPSNRNGLSRYIEKGETDLYIYYSGHAFRENKGQDVYLFPWDATYNDLTNDGYNINVFYQNILDLNPRSVTIFIDACFSGLETRSTHIYAEAATPAKLRGIWEKKVVVIEPWKHHESFTIFTSSGFEEQSRGFDATETGLFTYFLCAGLQGHADLDKDGKVTYKELIEYLKKNVEEEYEESFPTGSQTPKVFGPTDRILLELE